MTTPTLHLETLFVLDGQGRILHTREPGAAPGPLFFLARGETSCAWAVHADVPPPLAQQLTDLVQQETSAPDLRAAPIYAARYRSILEPVAGASLYPSGGVAFAFPKTLRQPTGVVPVTDEQLLSHNFSGWEPGEIEAGRGPMWAVAEAGIPISICFCARSSEQAAEAGLETTVAHRGRGLAARVTAAWAWSIQQSGRIPLYSTAWANHASQAVARKLGLVAYAGTWSLSA